MKYKKVKCPRCKKEEKIPESIINFNEPIKMRCNCGEHYSISIGKIRKFKTGATRNDVKDRLDFEGFLSPLVIQRYGQYMHKHRKQSDGTLRDSDNWQNGFGDKHFNVCMKSLWRHFFDLWMEHRGFKARETIDDAICGILFNVMAYYHQLIINRRRTFKSKELDDLPKKKEKK